MIDDKPGNAPVIELGTASSATQGPMGDTIEPSGLVLAAGLAD